MLIARRKRVPFRAQSSAIDCGAACLSMLLAYFGHDVRPIDLALQCEPGRHGISASKLGRVAERYGVTLHGRALQLEDLRLLATPAILHWSFSHWVILERTSRRSLRIVDPAQGVRMLSWEEVSQRFTGIALIPEKRTTTTALPAMMRRSALKDVVRKLPWHRLSQVLAALLLCTALAQILGVLLARLSGAIFARFPLQNGKDVVLLMAASVVAIVVARVALSQGRIIMLTFIRAYADSSVLMELFRKLLSLPFPFLLVRGSGDLTARMNNYFALRQLVTDQVSGASVDALFCLIYGIALYKASSVACAVAVLCAIVSTACLWVRYRREKELWIVEMEADTQKSRTLYDMLRGFSAIKASGLEDDFARKWQTYVTRHINASTDRSFRVASWQAAAQVAREVIPYIIIVVGAHSVMSKGTSPGQVFVELFLATGLLGPLTTLLDTVNQLRLAKAYWDCIDDVFLIDNERRGGETPIVTNGIECRGVCFAYPGEVRHVLKGFSCFIPQGKMTAVVGESGSGKSTIVNLLLGMLAPQSGEILYGGVSQSHVDLQQLRRRIGTVLQEETLFEGSILDNIAGPNSQVTYAEVIEAAQRVNIHADICAMPSGYETFLCENGAGISGGQKQRIALARALVTHPDVVILDEATSNLDSVTAAQIDSVLRGLNCTRIVISHRLSAIKDADNIVVLKDGIVVEQGSHATLMHARGAYWELFSPQWVTGEIEPVDNSILGTVAKPISSNFETMSSAKERVPCI